MLGKTRVQRCDQPQEYSFDCHDAGGPVGRTLRPGARDAALGDAFGGSLHRSGDLHRGETSDICMGETIGWEDKYGLWI